MGGCRGLVTRAPVPVLGAAGSDAGKPYSALSTGEDRAEAGTFRFRDEDTAFRGATSTATPFASSSLQVCSHFRDVCVCVCVCDSVPVGAQPRLGLASSQ